MSKGEAVKLQIHMPRNADAQYTDSWVRCATFHHTTGPRLLAAYEMAWSDFSRLSLEERVQECSEHIGRFRQMCEQSSLAKETSGYYVFSIAYPQYVDLLMEKDKAIAKEKLDRYMQDQGGLVCKVAFEVMTGGSFETYLKEQGEEPPVFVGACKILLTLRQEDERICFLRHKTFLSTEQETLMAKMVAGENEEMEKQARDFLQNPEVQHFLKHPTSDPMQLAQAMAHLSVEDLDLVQQHLNVSCAYCHKERPGMPKCGKCRNVCYCGPTCQKEHWKVHKKICGK